MPRFVTYSLLSLMIVLLLSSCMTYTQEEAKLKIAAVPSVTETPLPSTKMKKVEDQPLIAIAEISKSESPQIQEITTFSAALVPLPCQGSAQQLAEVQQFIQESHFDIIGFSGDDQTLVSMSDMLSIPMYWTENGLLVATDFPLVSQEDTFLEFQVANEQTLHVAIVDLQDSTVFQKLNATLSTQEWETVVMDAHSRRLASVDSLLSTANGDYTLIFASLGEPSATDWFETATAHPYRIQLRWPMVEAFERSRYVDSWKLTHYDAISSPGTTWKFVTEDNTFAERVDYLFQRGLLPIETKVIPLESVDTKKFPYEQRSVVTGTFMIP